MPYVCATKIQQALANNPEISTLIPEEECAKNGGYCLDIANTIVCGHLERALYEVDAKIKELTKAENELI